MGTWSLWGSYSINISLKVVPIYIHTLKLRVGYVDPWGHSFKGISTLNLIILGGPTIKLRYMFLNSGVLEDPGAIDKHIGGGGGGGGGGLDF